MNVKPPITVMTSREFNQDTAKAKRAAKKGPVYITERGHMSHVLLSKEEYERMKAAEEETLEGPKSPSLREALVDRVHGDDIELIIPKRLIELPRKIDFD